MKNIIIIGAGLSGLSTAYFLQKRGVTCKILEAQDRLGGRIQTIYGERDTPMEMGATWFGSQHQALFKLLSELNVDYFHQHEAGIALFERMSFEPPQQHFVTSNSQSAYRIKGGTYEIINALANYIGDEHIILNTEVTQIIDEGDTIKIVDNAENEYNCDILIISIPPKILANHIQLIPPLPDNISRIMRTTQTWMSGSIKFAVEYLKPFWREKGFSGNVYSQSGFASEIYDHCNYENSRFSLKGFLIVSAINYSYKERQLKVIAQLADYFGAEAYNLTGYNDKIWDDRFVAFEDDFFLPPHANNGHLIFRNSYMKNNLFFTGTETSEKFGGYMDGAVSAAELTAIQVSHFLK